MELFSWGEYEREWVNAQPGLALFGQIRSRLDRKALDHNEFRLVRAMEERGDRADGAGGRFRFFRRWFFDRRAFLIATVPPVLVAGRGFRRSRLLGGGGLFGLGRVGWLFALWRNRAGGSRCVVGLQRQVLP